MKGRGALYSIFSVTAFLCAVAGTASLIWYGIEVGDGLSNAEIAVFCVACAMLIVFPLNLVVHELGHTLFGLLCGMKPVSVQIAHFSFGRGKVKFMPSTSADGMSVMLARSVKNLRGKLIFSALGGIVCNFIYGAVFLILCFLAPSPAVLFFALFAPLNLYEGLMALVPAQRPTGATDGAIVYGLIKRKPFAEAMLFVIRAQSALLKGTYHDIPREWLFDAPVIREDDVLFLALTQLRWQYLFRLGDEAGAIGQLQRLEEAFEYFEDADLACDLVFMHAVLFSDTLRAEEYLTYTDGAKGTVSYNVAMLACGQAESGKVTARAEREKSVGIRDFALYEIERMNK